MNLDLDVLMLAALDVAANTTRRTNWILADCMMDGISRLAMVSER